MPRTSRRLLVPLAALLLALPLAACEQDGGSEPSITTEEEAGEATPLDDPAVADPQPSPGTDDGSTTDDEDED